MATSDRAPNFHCLPAKLLLLVFFSNNVFCFLFCQNTSFVFQNKFLIRITSYKLTLLSRDECMYALAKKSGLVVLVFCNGDLQCCLLIHQHTY